MLEASTLSIKFWRRNLNNLLEEQQVVDFLRKKVTIHNRKQAAEYLEPQKASQDLISERHHNKPKESLNLGKSAGRTRQMKWSRWTLMKKRHKTIEHLKKGRGQKTLEAIIND